MAVIVKNPVAFRCKSFAERYKDHEASSLLEEASQLIQELEDDLAERSLAERAAVPEGLATDANIERFVKAWDEIEDAYEGKFLRNPLTKEKVAYHVLEALSIGSSQ